MGKTFNKVPRGTIRDRKSYDNLEINGVHFEDVTVFIQRNFIEIIDDFGNMNAFIFKTDIKTIEIN